MSGGLSTHNPGRDGRVKAMDEDGTEARSQRSDDGNGARAMEPLRQPSAKTYWLRERNLDRRGLSRQCGVPRGETTLPVPHDGPC